jgi:small-conductance mechanosensitive channel
MLSAIALKFMTDQREMELSQFLKALTFKASFGHYGAIDLPLTINDANDATKQTAIDALEGALKAKRFLNNEIKVEKKLNKTLRSAYKSMKVQAESDRKLENIAKQIEELLN